MIKYVWQSLRDRNIWHGSLYCISFNIRGIWFRIPFCNKFPHVHDDSDRSHHSHAHAAVQITPSAEHGLQNPLQWDNMRSLLVATFTRACGACLALSVITTCPHHIPPKHLLLALEYAAGARMHLSRWDIGGLPVGCKDQDCQLLVGGPRSWSVYNRTDCLSTFI